MVSPAPCFLLTKPSQLAMKVSTQLLRLSVSGSYLQSCRDTWTRVPDDYPADKINKTNSSNELKRSADQIPGFQFFV
jgi:hypothetical protein